MSIETQRAVEAMALLEALLQQRNSAFGDEAKPIQFDFGGELWSFDPQRAVSRCRRQPHPEARLTVHCTPKFLGRLLLQPDLYLAPGEELRLVGDAAALTPLMQALIGPAK